MGGGSTRSPPLSSSSSAATPRDVGNDSNYDDLITTQTSESDPDTVHVHLRAPPAAPMSSTSSGACTLKYCKSACYIHPSSYSRDNVGGWIAISKRGKRDFLLSWIPDAMVRSEDKDKFVRVEIGADGELEVDDEGEYKGISSSQRLYH